jgi:hypothetical protein
VRLRAGLSRRTPNLFQHWKDEAEQGAKAALGKRSAAASKKNRDNRIPLLKRMLGWTYLEIEILENFVWE